jgi:hypothetical protein
MACAPAKVHNRRRCDTVGPMALERAARLVLAVVVVGFWSRSARADPDLDASSPPRQLRWNAARDQIETPTEQPSPDAPSALGEQRPFVFLQDPSTPSSGHASIEYGVQASSGTDAMRPLATTSFAPGAVHGLTASYGATGWLAPFVTGLINHGGATSEAPLLSTAQAGIRWQIPSPVEHLRLGVVTAWTREFTGASGVIGRILVSYDIARVRIAGNAHVEKVFAAGRDRIDLLAFGGVSVRTVGALRLGAEYVGQDLEDAFEREEAEGGARHYAGPTASWELGQGRVWITGGPAFGLQHNSAPVLGRLAVLAAF